MPICGAGRGRSTEVALLGLGMVTLYSARMHAKITESTYIKNGATCFDQECIPWMCTTRYLGNTLDPGGQTHVRHHGRVVAVKSLLGIQDTPETVE